MLTNQIRSILNVRTNPYLLNERTPQEVPAWITILQPARREV
jgi:hypothetical protein